MREITNKANQSRKNTHAELTSLQTKLDSLRNELALWKMKENTYAKLIASNQRWIRNIQCHKCDNQLGLGSIAKFENDFHPFMGTSIVSSQGETNSSTPLAHLVDKGGKIYELETQIIKFTLIKSIMNDRKTLQERKEQVERLQKNLKDICVQLVDMEIERKKNKTQPITCFEPQCNKEQLILEKQALIMEKKAILSQVRADLSNNIPVLIQK